MSRTRRPGAAALQNEIIDLSSLVERTVASGRVKVSLEDMMRCATVPDMELAAAKRTGGLEGQRYETRLKQYAEIRMQIARIGAPAEDKKPVLQTEQEELSDQELLDTHMKAPFVPVPDTDVDIPFILDVGRNDLSPEPLAPLSSVLLHRSFRRLMYCDLSNNDVTRVGTDFSSLVPFLDSLSKLENLRFLSLSGIALGVEGSTAVSNFLRVNRSVTHLDLSSTALTNEGVSQLLSAFPPPKEVANPYKDKKSSRRSQDEEFAAELADILASLEPASATTEQGSTKITTTNAPLMWIDLHQANMVDKLTDAPPSAELLARLLSLSTLQYLNLGRNTLTATCFKRIIEHVGSDHCAIRCMDLSHTGMSARYAMEFAKAVLDSTSKLEWLSLQGNRVGSDGAISFCFGLSRDPPNSGIRSRSVSSPVSSTGLSSSPTAGATSSTTPTNSSSALRFLDLRDNHIGEVGRKAISLSLRGIPVPDDFLDSYINAEEASAMKEKALREEEELVPWKVRRRSSAAEIEPQSPTSGVTPGPTSPRSGSPQARSRSHSSVSRSRTPGASSADERAALLAPLSPVGTGLRAIQALRRLEEAAATAATDEDREDEVKLREVPLPMPSPPAVLNRAGSVGRIISAQRSREGDRPASARRSSFSSVEDPTKSIHTLLQGRHGRVVLV